MKGRLASRWIALVCAALAFVLSLPAIGGGFVADDYLHRAFLHDHGLGPRRQSWAQLFTFFDGDPIRTQWLVDHGFMVWWTDPLLRVSFCRPLSAATHALDAWLFWDSPALQHVHSSLWYALLAWVAARAYRQLLGPTWIAGLAAIFYVVDASHGVPVAWLANRNALLAAVFAIGGFALYARGKRGLGALVFAGGLVSGESSVGALTFFVAHAYFLDDRPWVVRAKGLVPIGVVTATWAVLYRVLGYGVSGSGLYLEPMREPIAFMKAAVVHLPLLGATELGMPAPDPYAFFGSGLRIGFVVLAIAFIAWSVPAFVQTLRADRRAQFFLVTGVLSLLPSCATFPAGRLLVIPSFAWLGLLALVVEHATKGRAARSFRMWTLLAHVGIAPITFELALQEIAAFGRSIQRVAAGVPSGPETENRTLVVVDAPEATFMYYTLPVRRAAGDIVPSRLLVMAPGSRKTTVRRTDERTLSVAVEDGLYRNGTETLTRKGPLPVGWTTVVNRVAIEVTATTPDGIPSEMTFRFDGDLSKDFEWRAWDGAALVPFVWPAIGETKTFEGHLPPLF